MGMAGDNVIPTLPNWCSSMVFDIFGTQEGKYHQLQDLKNAMPGYDYIGVGRDDGKQAGEYSAIFYRTGKFEVLDHGTFGCLR